MEENRQQGGPGFVWSNQHALFSEFSELVWEIARSDSSAFETDFDMKRLESLASRPIFVIGCHRSGTTLMRNLLDGHPELVALPSEGNLLTNFHPRMKRMAYADQVEQMSKIWLKRLVHSINIPPYWLLGRTDGQRSPYVEFVKTVLAIADQPWLKPYAEFRFQIPIMLAYAVHSGRTKGAFWVDKSPGYERFVRTCLKRFPKARFVHVVRNPMDTLASMVALERAVFGHAMDARKNITAIKSALKSAKKWRRKLPVAIYQVVRFEDLTSMTESSLKTICDYLGIEVVDTLFTATVNGLPTKINSSFAEGPTDDVIAQLPPRAALLDSETIHILKRKTAKLASEFGYEY